MVATKLEARLPVRAGRAASASAPRWISTSTSPSGATDLVQLTGRLMLAPEEDGWRIFGFGLDDPRAETS